MKPIMMIVIQRQVRFKNAETPAGSVLNTYCATVWFCTVVQATIPKLCKCVVLHCSNVPMPPRAGQTFAHLSQNSALCTCSPINFGHSCVNSCWIEGLLLFQSVQTVVQNCANNYWIAGPLLSSSVWANPSKVEPYCPTQEPRNPPNFHHQSIKTSQGPTFSETSSRSSRSSYLVGATMFMPTLTS